MSGWVIVTDQTGDLHAIDAYADVVLRWAGDRWEQLDTPWSELLHRGMEIEDADLPAGVPVPDGAA